MSSSSEGAGAAAGTGAPNQTPATAAPLRVAVVGAGWAGREIWLPRLEAHPGYQVVAVVEPSHAGQDVAGHVAVGSHRELDPWDVDLAVVAVPNHLHAPVAADLLRAGIDVFVEKPVCLTSAEARELAEAELAAGAMLLAGSAAGHRADVAELYALAATVGEIRHVEASWVRAAGVPGRDGWFTSRERSGGGALMDLGWHLLDVAGPLLGSDPVFGPVSGSVSADFVNRRTSRAVWRDETESHSAAGDVEDTARGFLVTADGPSLGLRASWASHEPLDVTRFRVEGRHGSVTLDCTFGFSPNRVASRLTRTEHGVSTTRPVPAVVGGEYARQLDALPALRADRTGRGRAITRAARIVDVIERLYAGAGIDSPATVVERFDARAGHAPAASAGSARSGRVR